ncbi:MAG: DUF4870 domain-containing protein [Candidatus Micrarchaeota archaeon]
MAKARKKKSEYKSNANLTAAVSYVLFIVTGIIIYLMEKRNGYVRFHAMQSILLTVVLVVINVVLNIAGMMFGFLTLGFGVVLFKIIWALFGLAVFLLWLFLMWKAYSGEKYKLPLVGRMAEKNA